MQPVNIAIKTLPWRLASREEILVPQNIEGIYCVSINPKDSLDPLAVMAVAIVAIVTGIFPFCLLLCSSSFRTAIWKWCHWNLQYVVSSTQLQGSIGNLFASINQKRDQTIEQINKKTLDILWHHELEAKLKEEQQDALTAVDALGTQDELNEESEENFEKALLSYEHAANRGDVEAQYEVGEIYRKKEQHQIAFTWYSKAAERGHVEAQYALGSCYYFGIGVEPNHANAVKMWTLCAQQRHILARSLLVRKLELHQHIESEELEVWKLQATLRV